MKTVQGENGRFVRQRISWDGSDWNAGHLVKGRMRVYRPDYPKCHAEGYAQRAHIVYWLKTGEYPKENECMHHIDGNKMHDEFENLRIVPFGRHTHDHCVRQGVQLVCEQCGKEYMLPVWRVSARTKDGHPPKFCSSECFYKYPKSEETKAATSRGILKAFAEGRM